VISAAWTSIGLGVVALTRSIALAMGIALGISFLDSIVAPFVDFYETVSLTSASNGIFEIGGDGPLSAFIPGADMSAGHSLAVMAGWAALFLALTWWGLQRRDA
jgi:ABC-type transport system involved in multi-copper enzyme maturation permease subunit